MFQQKMHIIRQQKLMSEKVKNTKRENREERK